MESGVFLSLARRVVAVVGSILPKSTAHVALYVGMASWWALKSAMITIQMIETAAPLHVKYKNAHKTAPVRDGTSLSLMASAVPYAVTVSKYPWNNAMTATCSIMMAALLCVKSKPADRTAPVQVMSFPF